MIGAVQTPLLTNGAALTISTTSTFTACGTWNSDATNVQLIRAQLILAGLQTNNTDWFTIYLRDTTDNADVFRQSFYKANATDTVFIIPLPSFYSIANKAYGLFIQSNSTGNSSSFTTNWFDVFGSVTVKSMNNSDVAFSGTTLTVGGQQLAVNTTLVNGATTPANFAALNINAAGQLILNPTQPNITAGTWMNVGTAQSLVGSVLLQGTQNGVTFLGFNVSGTTGYNGLVTYTAGTSGLNFTEGTNAQNTYLIVSNNTGGNYAIKDAVDDLVPGTPNNVQVDITEVRT